MSGRDCAVRLEGISTRIEDHVIHKDLDLCVERGEILGLVGGSGSGKTTLLRVIMGLEHAVAGSVEVLGQALGEDVDEEIWRGLRERWGVLFQGGALFTELTVLENIALPLQELRLLDDDLIQQLALHKLVEVGLHPRDARRRPSELSGGMVKRAALARALALEPELLLLDEPTSGLDPASSEEFVELISSLQQELGLTALVVTHDLDTLIDLCDRVAVLADQKLIVVGPVAEVAVFDHPFIREYFGGPRGQRALAGADRR